MRKMMLAIVVLWGNAFTWGYDGTLLNALQSMPQWNAQFDTPTGDILGELISPISSDTQASSAPSSTSLPLSRRSSDRSLPTVSDVVSRFSLLAFSRSRVRSSTRSPRHAES